MAKTEITLAQAKRIAGRVGARITPDKDNPGVFIVTISGRSFKDLNGEMRSTKFYASPALQAAHTAVIQTGAYCHALLELCKYTYVNEDVLFRHWGAVEEPKGHA